MGEKGDLTAASGSVIELAKTFMAFMNNAVRNWSVGYFRAYVTVGENGANASVFDGVSVEIVDAVGNSQFFKTARSQAKQVFTDIGFERGVLLLTCRSDFSYDIKFERENLTRWEITKMGGKTGVPDGESLPE
jgi:hypothetical protein